MKFCVENSTPENSRPTVMTNLEDSDHENNIIAHDNEKNVQREFIRLQNVEICIWKNKKQNLSVIHYGLWPRSCTSELRNTLSI